MAFDQTVIPMSDFPRFTDRTKQTPPVPDPAAHSNQPVDDNLQTGDEHQDSHDTNDKLHKCEVDAQRATSTRSKFAHLAARGWGNLLGLSSFLASPLISASVAVTVLSILVSSQKVLDFHYHLELGAILTGFIFPLVFTMNASWNALQLSREYVNRSRAQLLFIYWTQVNWLAFMKEPVDDFDKDAFLRKLHRVIDATFRHLIDYLRTNDNCKLHRAMLFKEFRRLMMLTEHMNQAWGLHFASSSQVSRLTDAELRLMENFMNLESLKNERMPWGLLVFAFIATLVAPMFLGPHLVDLACDETSRVKQACGYGGSAAYVTGILYALIVSSIFRVILDLENPFDGKGFDDLNLAAAHEDQLGLLAGEAEFEVESLGEESMPTVATFDYGEEKPQHDIWSMLMRRVSGRRHLRGV